MKDLTSWIHTRTRLRTSTRTHTEFLHPPAAAETLDQGQGHCSPAADHGTRNLPHTHTHIHAHARTRARTHTHTGHSSLSSPAAAETGPRYAQPDTLTHTHTHANAHEHAHTQDTQPWTHLLMQRLGHGTRYLIHPHPHPHPHPHQIGRASCRERVYHDV